MKKYIDGIYVEVTEAEREKLNKQQQEYEKSAEYKQEKIEYLKKQLADTDYIACKIAEGSATVNDYFEEISKRQLWREQINTLEGNDNDG